MDTKLDEFIKELQKIMSEFIQRVESLTDNAINLLNKQGCDNPPEWVIYDNEPYIYTYSCTTHLSDMVSTDTKVINPYEAVDIHAKQKACCYLYND